MTTTTNPIPFDSARYEELTRQIREADDAAMRAYGRGDNRHGDSCVALMDDLYDERSIVVAAGQGILVVLDKSAEIPAAGSVVWATGGGTFEFRSAAGSGERHSLTDAIDAAMGCCEIPRCEVCG